MRKRKAPNLEQALAELAAAVRGLKACLADREDTRERLARIEGKVTELVAQMSPRPENQEGTEQTEVDPYEESGRIEMRKLLAKARQRRLQAGGEKVGAELVERLDARPRRGGGGAPK